MSTFDADLDRIDEFEDLLRCLFERDLGEIVDAALIASKLTQQHAEWAANELGIGRQGLVNSAFVSRVALTALLGRLAPHEFGRALDRLYPDADKKEGEEDA